MASVSLQPGDIVEGRYRLVQRIGGGPTRAIWSARDDAGIRDVAIRFLSGSELGDRIAAEGFLHAAELATKLHHIHIVETYGSGRHLVPGASEPIPYLVTELLDGEPLTDTLRRTGALPAAAALDIARDMARAAEAAHCAGVRYRHLTAASVFLHRARDGAVIPKMLEFGLSKPADPAADDRSEVSAIGVVLRQCLTGRIEVHQVAGKDTSFDDLPWLPDGVATVLDRCLRRKGEERYASAADLAVALEQVIRTLDLSTDLRILLPPRMLWADGTIDALAESSTERATGEAARRSPASSLFRRDRTSWGPIAVAIAAAVFLVAFMRGRAAQSPVISPPPTPDPSRALPPALDPVLDPALVPVSDPLPAAASGGVPPKTRRLPRPVPKAVSR